VSFEHHKRRGKRILSVSARAETKEDWGLKIVDDEELQGEVAPFAGPTKVQGMSSGHILGDNLWISQNE
jgi:hypothetical protein